MMWIYLTVVFCAAFFAILWQRAEAGLSSPGYAVTVGKKQYVMNKKMLWMMISLLLMWFCPALIVGTGGDYWNYVQYFFTIANQNPIKIEPGFVVIVKFIQLFSQNPQWLFVVFNLINYGLLFYCLRKYSTHYGLSLICLLMSGLYLVGIPQMRQLASTMLVLVSYQYIIDRKLIKFLLVVALAACFHTSALIALPLYFLLQWQFKFSIYCIAAAALMLMSVYGESIIYRLLEWFYPQYLTVAQGYFTSARSFNFLTFLLLVPPILLLVLYYNRLDLGDRVNLVFTNATLLYILATIGLFWLPNMYRLTSILNISTIFVIPRLLAEEQNKKFRMLLTICIILFGLIAVYLRFLMIDSHHLIPYVSIFDWKDKMVLS